MDMEGELTKNLEEYLKKTYGTERIQSGVQVNNEAGIIFWKKMGFQIDNKPRDIGDGTTAFEMSKDL